MPRMRAESAVRLAASMVGGTNRIEPRRALWLEFENGVYERMIAEPAPLVVVVLD
jgi:hypothetical protein